MRLEPEKFAKLRVAPKLLNKTEVAVLSELQEVCVNHNMLVFPKVRLSDIILKERTLLTNREFSFYTKSHCDFVVTDNQMKPLFIVEYDGPLHFDQVQTERDVIKNDLCKRAGIGLLRINDRHVSRIYRGMSLLRWILEVAELERSFYEAQTLGQIPNDEPFMPAFVMSDSSSISFSYWLSAPSVKSFHKFLDRFPSGTPKGWASILGYDEQDVSHRLSCLHFGDKVLWAKTAVRNQDFDFPRHDFHEEVDSCELGICLKNYCADENLAYSRKDFQTIVTTFTGKYRTHLNYSMGGFPFEAKFQF